MAENDGGGNNAGGSGTVDRPAWLASMPDAFKQNEAFSQFPEAAKFYEKADQLLRAESKSIVIPDETATEQQRAAFFAKLGRPETADKYSLAKPEGLPETIPYSVEAEKAFRAVAHQEGLSDKQAKKIYDWYYDLAKTGYAQQEAAQKAANEKAVNALKDQWKGDEFKVNTELAARAFKKFAGDNPEVKDFIEQKQVDGIALGNHPVLLKLFHGIAKAIGDDTISAGERGGQGGKGEMSDEERAKSRFPATYSKK